MRKDNRLRELFDEIPVPSELEPENIAKMLKSRTAASAMPIKEKKTAQRQITLTKGKRKDVHTSTRITATIAACLMLTLGISVFFKSKDMGTLITPSGNTETSKVITASSYSDIYNNFQKVYVMDDNEVELEKIISHSTDSGKYTDEAEVYVLKKQLDAANVIEVEQYDNSKETVSALKPDTLTTDGKFLYYIANDTLYIIDTKENRLELVVENKPENIIPCELYLKDNCLIVISNKVEEIPAAIDTNTEKILSDSSENTGTSVTADTSESVTSEETQISTSSESSESQESTTTEATTETTVTQTSETTASSSVVNEIIQQKAEKISTLVEILDITDPSNPTLLNRITQDGEYISSQITGGYLYIASDYEDNRYSAIENEDDIEKYVPSFTVNNEKKYIEPENIIFPNQLTSTNYIVISSLDFTNVSPVTSIKALFGYKDYVYFSDKYIYSFANIYTSQSQETTVVRMEMKDGAINDCVTTKISGVIKNASSLSEYDGYLRIATSLYNKDKQQFTNGLYILNSDMKQCGKLTGFGGTEIFQTVIYDASAAYFTAGDESNTKIAIDCSDAKNPSIYDNSDSKGSLSQIIRFSDNEFIAFGYNADESGQSNGLKLAVYEKSTDGGYTEKTSLVIEKDVSNASSPALTKSGSMLIDKASGIIGIPVSYNDGIDLCNRYYVFTYKDGVLTQNGSPIETHDLSTLYSFDRALLIGNTIYSVSGGRIVGADTETMMSTLKTLNLVEPSIVSSHK